MKILNIKLALALLLSALMFLSVGCNKDDENNPTGGNVTAGGLTGTWSLSEATINPGTDSAQVFNQTLLQLAGVSMVLVVNEGGTYSITTADSTGPSTETGTWSVSGNNITITPTGDTGETLPFSLDGNSLTLTVAALEFGEDIFPAILKFTKQ
jgi:lipocalin-like protein